MPPQFTLPPDTRVAGSGNPPADMNGVTDAVTAMGAGSNILNAAYSGGADPSGVADSAAAIQAAVNTGRCYIPAGTYKTTATITVPSGTRIRGDGPGLSVLVPASDYGDVLVLAKDAGDCHVTDLAVTYTGITRTSSSTPSTHAAVKFTPSTAAFSAPLTQRAHIERLEIAGMGQGIWLPYVSGTSVAYASYEFSYIRDIEFFSCNIGMFITAWADGVIENVNCGNMFGQNASSLQSKVLSGSGGTDPGTYSAACQNLLNLAGNDMVAKVEVYGGTGDGIVFQQCVTTHARGLEVGSSAVGNGVVLDLCGTGMEVNAHVALNTSGHGIYCDGVTDTVFYGCRLDTCAYHGMYFANVLNPSNPCAQVTLVACEALGNGHSASNTYDGVNYSGSDLQVLGGVYSDPAGSPTQRYGINATASGDDYTTVIGAACTGNVNTAEINLGGSHSAAINCHGVNYSGFGTFTPAVPATGAGNAVGNGNPYAVTVYLTGQNGTGIQDRAGTQVTVPGNPPAVRLGPGEKIYFITTAPSSWKWYGD